MGSDLKLTADKSGAASDQARIWMV